MGIVKIKPQKPGNRIQASRCSSTTVVQHDLLHEEKLILQKAPIDFVNDTWLEEIDSELIMVGGQTCNVPYELYELPDLLEILNLETWNDCLTEDERFSLAVFLPGMDQETFWFTMKQLLSGDVMFFRSPLEKFFSGLKGGFYHMQVTYLRESAQFFQRREYYHFLRSYHENMAQKFVSMKRIWNKYQPGISIEERIHLWNNRKHHKPVLLVDLNAYPEDDAINKNDKTIEMVPFSKKRKHLNNSHEIEVAVGSMKWKNKTKARGALKIKPIEMNSVQSYAMYPFTAETMEPPKRAPKGVLKLKPKQGSTDPLIASKNQKNVAANFLSINYTPGISSQYAFQHEDHGMLDKLPYLHQIERDATLNRNLEFVQDQQREEPLTKSVVPVQNSQNCKTQLKFMKGMMAEDATESSKSTFGLEFSRNSINYSHESGQTENWHGRKALWKHSKAKPVSFTHLSSKAPKSELFQDGVETYQETRANNTNSISLRISGSSNINKDHLSRDNSDNLDCGLKDQADELVASSGCIDNSGCDQDLLLPITYKKKKTARNLKHEEPLKQQRSVVSMEPANVSGTLSIKPKSIKIKFKGLTGYK